MSETEQEGINLPTLHPCDRCDTNMTYGAYCGDCVVYIDIHYGDDA